MLRPSAQPGALLSAVQRSDTAVLRIAVVFFAITALVQLAYPVQYAEFAPPRALSKNAWAGATKAVLSVPVAGVAKKAAAYAAENCWPPSVVMYGTESRFCASISLRMMRPM